MAPSGKSQTALELIEELRKSSRIPLDELDALDARYRRLQEACSLAQDREKSLLKALRRQQNEALGERLKVERAREVLEQEQNEAKLLDADNERIQKELAEYEQNSTAQQYDAAELERTVQRLALAADELSRENDALVRPKLQEMNKELELAKHAFEALNKSYERDAQTKQALSERLDFLAEEKRRLAMEAQCAKEMLQKVSVEPERVRKQAECVQKATVKLEQDIFQMSDKRKTYETELARQLSRRKEAEEVRNNLVHKLELHCDTILHRQRDVDAVKTNVDIEKARTHQLAELKVKLDMNRKELEETGRHETDALSMSKKELDVLQRRYRKKRRIADAAKEVLPTLKAQLTDSKHLLRSHMQGNKRLVDQIKGIRQEVDLGIARLLRQEGIEKSKRSGLEALLKQVACMEDEIGSWSAEERRQNKLIAVLSAQREMKAREATRAQAAEKDTREQVRVKELVILDMSKKANETMNRLKEFSALYDVVKNERNKYVNLIQSSSQALAEMKEKIKILMNEVEILRNESLAKDKALAKEHTQHLASQSQRDGLRLDLYKAQSEYRNKQDSVEQQIVEIDKLNSLINNLERGMLRLKALYVKAVEARNAVGVDLIDRNDELCILYEKVNLQEQTIKHGELGVRQKNEDVRMLKLQLSELQRQVSVSRKQLPKMPTLIDAIVDLKTTLEKERRISESLCKCLESPSNSLRWRSLQGDDPDREQLLAKAAVLEERLSLKKETLFENELVLEEITTLTNKLKNRAKEGRDSALYLAGKINDFQAKLRYSTKCMMATVSELSMYQATAMKLQQQKRRAQIKLEESNWCYLNDEPPSDYALAALHKRICTQSDIPALDVAKKLELESSLMRTTADPRPNAYIPDIAHGLGVPKPYSSLAPFRPSIPGSTMRHYRPPNPPDIAF